MPSMTTLVPLQWNSARRPAICGKRPVLTAELQNGENPLMKAVSHLGAGQRLDDGRVAEREDREQLAERDHAGAFLAGARRVAREVRPEAARVRVGRLGLVGVLVEHRVGDEVAHRRLVEPGGIAEDVERLGPDDLLEDRLDLGVGRGNDRLDVRASRDADGLRDAGRAAGPGDVAVLDHELEHGVARAGVDPLGDEDVAAHEVRDAMGVADDHRVDRAVLELVGDAEDRTIPRGLPASDRTGSSRTPSPGG